MVTEVRQLTENIEGHLHGPGDGSENFTHCDLVIRHTTIMRLVIDGAGDYIQMKDEVADWAIDELLTAAGRAEDIVSHNRRVFDEQERDITYSTSPPKNVDSFPDDWDEQKIIQHLKSIYGDRGWLSARQRRFARNRAKHLTKMLDAGQEYKCVVCGVKNALTIDHIKPMSRGGGDEVENLQFLCGFHNSQKGNRYDQ